MSETPLANAPEARTPTGEIVNQATPPETPKAPEAKTPVAPPTDPKLKEGESVLGKEGEKKPEAKPGAPEKYETFTVPEGVTLDEKTLTDATAMFKEMGLDQAGAQKLIDFHTAKAKEAAEAPGKAWNDLRTDWQNKVKADPEIGGKLSEVRETVGRALDSLGPELAREVRDAMNLTGAGDHPAIVKAFYKMAQAVNEGKHVAGGNPSPAGQKAPNSGPRSAASAMYPNLP